MKKSHETIFVAAGEKIEIFNRRFSSVPMNYQFSAKSTDSKMLSGLLEIHSKKIIFASPVKTIKLDQLNTVHASLWDTFMTIYVVAECDMEITIPQREFTSLKRILVLVAALVSAAVGMVLLN